MGDYVVGVTVSAPSSGTDPSLLSMDGKRLADVFSLPVNESEFSPGERRQVLAMSGYAVCMESRTVAFRQREGEMTVETPWGQSIRTRAEAVVIGQTDRAGRR